VLAKIFGILFSRTVSQIAWAIICFNSIIVADMATIWSRAVIRFSD
jgi:hypothetical protein